MTQLTDETWYPSIEKELADADVQALRREILVRQRKEIQATPGQWRKFHVFATRKEAVSFCRTVNNHGHPLLRGRYGNYEAEHLHNLVYLIYRKTTS